MTQASLCHLFEKSDIQDHGSRNDQPSVTNRSFLSLPSEIRHMIYEELLLDTDQGAPSGLWLIRPKCPPTECAGVRIYHSSSAILRTCKLIHAEALEALYKNAFNMRFIIRSEQPLYTPHPLRALRDRAHTLARITTLRMFLDVEDLDLFHTHAVTDTIHLLQPRLHAMRSLETLELQIRVWKSMCNDWRWQITFVARLDWLIGELKPYVPRAVQMVPVVSYPSGAECDHASVEPRLLLAFYEGNASVQGSRCPGGSS